MEQITFIFETVGKVNGIRGKSLNPETVEAILKALPVGSTVNTWGDGIYFSTPVWNFNVLSSLVEKYFIRDLFSYRASGERSYGDFGLLSIRCV